jgi:hypothetical protein
MTELLDNDNINYDNFEWLDMNWTLINNSMKLSKNKNIFPDEIIIDIELRGLYNDNDFSHIEFNYKIFEFNYNYLVNLNQIIYDLKKYMIDNFTDKHQLINDFFAASKLICIEMGRSGSIARSLGIECNV